MSDLWKAVAQQAGVCMSCALGAVDGCCTDCLNTGWDGGEPREASDLRNLLHRYIRYFNESGYPRVPLDLASLGVKNAPFTSKEIAILRDMAERTFMTATYENAMQAFQQATFAMLDVKEAWTKGDVGLAAFHEARQTYATASADYHEAFKLDIASRPRETGPMPDQMELV